MGIGLSGLLAAVLAINFPGEGPFSHASDRLLAEARTALDRKEYDAAEHLANRFAPGHRLWNQSRLVAGEAAMRAGRLTAAVEYFAAVPRDGSRPAIVASLSEGEVLREIGRLSEAEPQYRYVLQEQPDNAAAHERLAFILHATGQRWESLPHLLFLIRRDRGSLDSLALLGDLDRPMEQREYLQRCLENAPDDDLVRLGLAANTLAEGRSAEALRLLRDVVGRAPQIVAAQTMLGELLVDADDGTFLAWHSALPHAAEMNPDTWFVRGLWARRNGAPRVAARCFWETIRLAPTHRRGNYQLGQVLISLGEDLGRDFFDRSTRLFELTQALDIALKSRGHNVQVMHRIAELMEETGRLWEARAWAVLAAQDSPSTSWPRTVVSRLDSQLNDQLPQTTEAANLAFKHDLSTFPGHREFFARFRGSRSPQSAGGTSNETKMPSSRASIHFDDRAGQAGIGFAYNNGPDLSTKGVRMLEQTGGGVAVLDIDGDGRPDVYFPQGAEWKNGAQTPAPAEQDTDRLYRNLGDKFADVTREARLSDREFGQGCSAGDVDNDGFPDVYVANIGLNRLQRNNGDGTFSDVTEITGLEGEVWTASCVIVDLNADGLPDLFDVTYLTGPRIYELLCNDRACSPKAFSGVPDRLWISRGDGTFDPAPIDATAENSKGLGVVAADLGQPGRPALFVSNDQVQNFLMWNVPSDDRFRVQLQDQAFFRGLAFNEDGLAMAGMGIAADDVDGDGRLDFLLTTFKDEPCTLYLQDAVGMFVDGTKSSGLRASTWPYVGWGTQFLDADRDGEPDLVITNGHVDDYRDVGGEYHMRPQFFRNTGNARFVELFAGKIGPYFGEKYLGRGLARLDWNGDGLMDFAVSNIGDRASLVTNASTDAGHYLNVRLHAVKTARDAIGTAVDVVTPKRRWSKQLVAGDGYMASNERLLQFGLGAAAVVTELHVHWPSGDSVMIRDVPVDSTVQLVESSSQAILRDGSTFRSLTVERSP